MKNYLVITLGTSEVQVLEEELGKANFQLSLDNKEVINKDNPQLRFNVKENRNRKGTFLFDSPRRDGKKVIDFGINNFMPILSFPLVLPAVTHFFERNPNEIIDKCLLVFTDQTDEKYRGNDTVYFKEILKQKLSLVLDLTDEDFVDFSIEKNVTLIDYQYKAFAQKCKTLLDTPEEEINQVVLFTQGGIDQINQALTLQFIQAYKHKVRLYQKAEDQEPVLLQFPQLFLRDLVKHQIIALINEGDYKAAFEIRGNIISHSRIPGGTVDKYILFAFYRINLLYDESIRIAKTIKSSGKAHNFIENVASMNSLLPNDLCPDSFNSNNWYKCGEIFEKVRFLLEKGNFSEAVLIFHNFMELLVNGCLDAIYNAKLTTKYDNYYTKVLNGIGQSFPNLYDSYNEKGNITLSIPLKLDALITDDRCESHIKLIFEKIRPYIKSKIAIQKHGGMFLNDARNRYAHEGKFISESDLPYFRHLVKDINLIMGLPFESAYIQINRVIAEYL